MRYWIVSILMTLLLMPGRSHAQTELSAKSEELTAGDFKEAIVKAQGTCLLPFGILEKHGPHLPLGTDLLNARYVAEHAAQEEYAIIFPEYFAGTSRAPSPIVPSCNCVCCRKPVIEQDNAFICVFRTH